MNFLAHLYLGYDDEGLMVGNCIADMIRPNEFKTLSTNIQNGILLHRKIDFFTDNHFLIKQGIVRLRQDFGKYAPVVIDIYCDYLLARNWAKYCSLSYEDFAQQIYKVLKKNMELVPPKTQELLGRFVQSEWLQVYQSIEGIRETFHRLKKRVKFSNNLENAATYLEQNVDSFENEFIEFFPYLLAFVQQERLALEVEGNGESA